MNWFRDAKKVLTKQCAIQLEHNEHTCSQASGSKCLINFFSPSKKWGHQKYNQSNLFSVNVEPDPLYLPRVSLDQA